MPMSMSLYLKRVQIHALYMHAMDGVLDETAALGDGETPDEFCHPITSLMW